MEYTKIANKVIANDTLIVEAQKATGLNGESVQVSVRKLYKANNGALCYGKQGISFPLDTLQEVKAAMVEVEAATNEYVAKNPLQATVAKQSANSQPVLAQAGNAYDFSKMNPSDLANLANSLQAFLSGGQATQPAKQPKLKKGPKNVL